MKNDAQNENVTSEENCDIMAWWIYALSIKRVDIHSGYFGLWLTLFKKENWWISAEKAA